MEESQLKKEIYQLIQSNEEILEFILNHASAGFYVLDCESEKVWIHPKVWLTLGYDPYGQNSLQALDFQEILSIIPDKDENPLQGQHPEREIISLGHQKGYVKYFQRYGRQVTLAQHQKNLILYCLRSYRLDIQSPSSPHSKTSKKDAQEATGSLVPEPIFLNDKKAKKNPREVIQHLQLATEVAQLGIWELDVQNGKISWNDHLFEIYGLDPNDSPEHKLNWQSMIHSDDRLEAHKGLVDMFQGQTVQNIRFRVLNKKGETRHVLASGAPVFNKKGELKKVIGVNIDISRLVQQKNALKESERRFKAFADNIPGLAFIKYPAGEHIFGNKPMLKHLGISLAEYVGFKVEDIKALDKKTVNIINEMDRLVFEEKSVLLREFHSPVDQKWYEEIKFPLDDQLVGGIMLDVSARKSNEKIKQENARKIRTLLESISDAFISINKEAKYTYINSRAAEIFNQEIKELIGKTISKEFPNNLRRKLFKSLEFGKFQYLESFHARKGRWYAYRIYPTQEGISLFFHDITERKDALAALQESRERYKNITDSVPGAVLRYQLFPDLSARLLFISQGARDLWELPPEKPNIEIIWLWKLIHPDDQDAFKVALNQSFVRLEFWNHQWRAVTPSGKVKWMNGRGNPKKEQDGSVIWDMIILDITERKLAEETLRESEEKLRQITENMQEVFWLLSADQKELLYINAAYEKVWGRSRQSIKNNLSTFKHTIYPDDLSLVLKALKNYQQTEKMDIEYRIIFPDKSIRWVRVKQFPVKDDQGNIIRHCGIAINISESKEADQIRKMAQALELKNQELEQFAYVASHDLKEPLRTIQNYIGLLQKNCQELLEVDTNVLFYFTFILEATERMKLLIQGLLDHSRLGKNPQAKVIDFKEVVHHVIRDLSFVIDQSQAKISLGELPKIPALEVEIHQLFQNLISNAIKFCHPDKAPQVKIQAHKENNTWIFSVEDNGIGISKKYEQKIFNFFQRLHHSHEYEGTGIGLAHCKKIVELHGGKIWFESTVNEGSTFFFSINHTKG